MSQSYDSVRPFTAGAAIARYLRVKLSAGVLAVAGAADEDLGTIQAASFASGDIRSVRLKNAAGSTPMVAAGAFSAGAIVYQAASGKVDDVANARRVGIALEAATADGDIVEILPDYRGQVTFSGEVTLDGTNPTPVTTGLSTITSAQVSLKSATAPGDDPSWVSCDYSGSDGTLNVYAWKNTGGTDPTLVASTNSSAVICWTATGT